jgi:hypothetical protein
MTRTKEEVVFERVEIIGKNSLLEAETTDIVCYFFVLFPE